VEAIMQLRGTSCCGLYELFELNQDRSAEQTLKQFVQKSGYKYKPLWTDNDEYDKPFSHVIFTAAHQRKAKFDDPEHPSYGTRFAEFIKANKLGSVTESATTENPNSGNQLRVYVWAVDWTKVKAWDQGKLTEKPKKTTKKAVTAK
jgi:hypothetical protein